MRYKQTRLRGLWAAVALAAGSTLLATGPAHAQDEMTIDHVETDDGTLSMVLSVDGITGGTVDPGTVAVTVDGYEAPSTAKTVTAGDIQRSTVLVVDVSNSMRKADTFDAATAAVDEYLGSAPADVAIGLVTFAGEVVDSIGPTADHTLVADTLADAKLQLGTSLYDAISAGIDLAGTEGSRSLLVLSDGADTGSETTLEEATQQAVDAGIVVDVVSLAGTAEAATLAGMTDSTSGTVIPADRSALADVFANQADALAQQLIVTAELPDGAAGDADVEVSLVAGGATYSDSALASLGQGDLGDGPQVVEPGRALVTTPMMLAGAVALFLGLGGLLSIVLLGAGGRSRAKRRLDAYFDAADGKPGGQRRASRADSPALKEAAVEMTGKVIKGDLEDRVAKRLAGAGSPLSVAEWVLLHAGIAVCAALAGFVFRGAPGGLLGLLLGALVPWLYLRRRHSKRLAAFNAQLAESLTLMAGGLSAGLSLPQAVDTVVREGQEPMAGELRRALVEQRLGVPFEDALDGLSERMESDDFAWVVMAIRIQREVGGNLAELLNTVADTLREREYLRRQVKVLSAEGRMSAYVLTALPPVMFIYLLFVRPDFVRVLYTTGIGMAMLGGAVALLAMGGFVITRIVKVEV